MMKRAISIGIMSALLSAGAMAQDAAPSLEFGGYTWDVQAERAELVTFKGKLALALEKGGLWADDANFEDGVISFKVAYPEHRAFIGAAWHIQDRTNYEEMYFRSHLNNTPDTIQYTPVNNGRSAWQIYTDGNALAPAIQDYDDWNDVKILIQGDRADIYFNSDVPVLHVPDLKNDRAGSGLSLRSSNVTDATTHFADLEIRPLQANEGIVGAPKPPKPVPDGLIQAWRVSSPIAEQTVAEQTKLPEILDITWQDLDVETNGIANLGRLSAPGEGQNTVLVKTTLTVDEAQVAEMRFGFSDRVRLYLNGELIYAGNDGFRTRTYRFLGLIGFYDSVGLKLVAGENEIVAAVSESFGGWGWTAAVQAD